MVMADLRVLIVSANPLARGGLAVLVEGMTGMKIVGATGVAEAASLAGQLLPDAVVPSKDELKSYWAKVASRALRYLGGRPLKLLGWCQLVVVMATFVVPALLQPLHDGWVAHYEKFAPMQLSWATVGIAVTAELTDGMVAQWQSL